MNEIADWLINRVKQKDNYEQISILQTVGRHGLRPLLPENDSQILWKTFSVQQLREQSYIQRTGVNLLGISEAAASIGLRATGIRTSMEKLKQQSKLPCIIHWNQEHFVVLYKIEKKRGKTWFYIADPAYGLLKYEEQELKNAGSVPHKAE